MPLVPAEGVRQPQNHRNNAREDILLGDSRLDGPVNTPERATFQAEPSANCLRGRGATVGTWGFLSWHLPQRVHRRQRPRRIATWRFREIEPLAQISPHYHQARHLPLVLHTFGGDLETKCMCAKSTIKRAIVSFTASSSRPSKKDLSEASWIGAAFTVPMIQRQRNTLRDAEGGQCPCALHPEQHRIVGPWAESTSTCGRRLGQGDHRNAHKDGIQIERIDCT